MYHILSMLSTDKNYMDRAYRFTSVARTHRRLPPACRPPGPPPRPPPAPVSPTARAAPVDRSSTRPRMKGPRSLTVTTTLRPPWVTLSLVPNGSERWAQVIAFWLKRAPEAVLLPDSLP